MAVYNKEIEKKHKEIVTSELWFATKNKAIDKAVELAKDKIVSVWKCENGFYVLPFDKWISAERLDYKQVVEAWEIKDKLKQGKENVEE